MSALSVSYDKKAKLCQKLAKWHAIDAVLFKGTGAGSSGCPSNPIITDNTVRDKDEKYFKDLGTR